jgi:hypothetical protein
MIQAVRKLVSEGHGFSRAARQFKIVILSERD